MQSMMKPSARANLGLLTLASLVAGLDYALYLLFPEGTILSVNRIVFPAICVYDVITSPSKYVQALGMVMLFGLILLVCTPFLIFQRQDINGFNSPLHETIALLGTVTYFMFFYVNSTDSESVSRICSMLFLCAAFVLFYILCAYLGIVDGQIRSWRGNVELTRSSGAMDPNIITIYFLACFAFGPLLSLHNEWLAGARGNIAIAVGMCILLLIALQTHSRAGAAAVAVSLVTAIGFRWCLSSLQNKRRALLGAVAFMTVSFGSAAAMQYAYGVFDTTLAVLRETYHGYALSSFEVRSLSYQFLFHNLLWDPSLCGSTNGYADVWQWVGLGLYPHCTLVDIYIKGGVSFLAVYIWLYCAAIVHCLRGLRMDAGRGAICGSLLAYLAGFVPLMLTLSVDGMKIPWLVLGVSLGYTTVHSAAHPRSTVAVPRLRILECRYW